jgi:hypothetical protein
MRRLFTLIFIFTIKVSIGQVSFQKNYGDTAEERAESIIELKNGYLLVGTKAGSFSANYNHKIMVVKTDRLGNEIWTKIYGGGASDYGGDAIDTEDGILIGGTTHNSNKREICLIKTDYNGNQLWSKILEGNIDLKTLIKTRDGNLLIGGHAYSGSTSGINLIKIDKNGNEIWRTTSVNSYDNSLYSVKELSDGGFGIIGATFKNVNTSLRDILFIRTNEYGAPYYEKTYGGHSYDTGFDFLEVNDGFILAGSSQSYSQAGNLENYIVKIDVSGELVLEKIVRSPTQSTGIFSLVKTSNNTFLSLSGESIFGTPPYEYNINVIEFDFKGDSLSARIYGGSKNDFGKRIIKTSDGGFGITGFSTSFNVNGDRDFYFLKLDSDLKLLSKINNHNDSKIIVFPNPTLGIFNFEYDLKGKKEGVIYIYNSFGGLIKQVKLYESIGKAQVDVSENPAGIYFFSLEVNGEELHKGKLVLVR